MGENNKKAKRSLEMVMSSFTDDLWIEIFIRLPFKSLVQLKSVSKSWFSIISSHRFAKSHFATVPKHDDILIVHHEIGNYDEEEEEEEDDGSFSLFYLDSGHNIKNLGFPYSQGEYAFHTPSSILVGCDCGIVCVSVDLLHWPVSKKNFDIYLWNPATNHSKLIPTCATPDDDRTRRTSVTLGFGFDHIDLDFKLVRVVSSTLSAEVYSSNRNGWRTIESKPMDAPSSSFRVFRGFMIAIAIGCNASMISFNLNKEVFICGIKLPVSPFGSGFNIIEHKDTIAVIDTSFDGGEINLWTLDDETCICNGGVKASWTKVFVVDVFNVVGSDFNLLVDFVHILFSNFQFLLIEKNGERFLYNWNRNVTTKVPNRNYFEWGQYFKYAKSLFSLQGFKRVK